MRAVAVRDFQATPELMDLPAPRAGPGEILVRLAAAGVNPFDWKIADGILRPRPHVFPLVLGVDGAGVVESVGPGVRRFHVGDPVFGSFLHDPVGVGTYAEWATVPETNGLAMIPPGLSAVHAAALPTAGMAALQSLDELGLSAGQGLLVVGATGGVGSFAVQLAVALGARVIAAARGDQATYTRSIGASVYVDLTTPGASDALRTAMPGGYDAILDVALRGPAFDEHLPLVRPGGAVASTIGAGDLPAITARGIRGLHIDMQPKSRLLERLADECVHGRLKVQVESEVPLSEGPAMIAQSRAGTARGKTVLRP